jgi:hypothetical protein
LKPVVPTNSFPKAEFAGRLESGVADCGCIRLADLRWEAGIDNSQTKTFLIEKLSSSDFRRKEAKGVQSRSLVSILRRFLSHFKMLLQIPGTSQTCNQIKTVFLIAPDFVAVSSFQKMCSLSLDIR